MENEIIRSAAKFFSSKINRYAKKDGLELQKLELGMEIFIINVSKFIIIYTLALLLGVLWQTFIVNMAFVLIKRYSFGLHALSSTITLTAIVKSKNLNPFIVKLLCYFLFNSRFPCWL